MQIEEKTPVEVCRTTRTNDAGIKINRGQAVRREGEKRRTKITKSKGNFINGHKKDYINTREASRKF